MLYCVLIKMLFLLILCPVLAAVQTLTIDSQLGTSIEDCFERISIGEQITSSAIYRNVSELTTRECELFCKQDKQCQTYDYGVGAKGNATCNLSHLNEKELKEQNLLQRHQDYDIYIRRFQCEQAPPTPIQAAFDDPGDRPLHRPVFRPGEEDPRRPLADDYPWPNDQSPYETARPDIRPVFRPQPSDDRPDDYNQKPAFDEPPSYGDHKPVDIPYRPSRQNTSAHYKPDPYDVLQFQDPYGRPRPEPGNWRPDPYNPPRPSDDIPDLYGPKPRPKPPNDFRPDPYRPEEKPDYHYIIRPNRKPFQTQINRPQDDTGYKPSKPDYPKPDSYGQNDPHPGGPIGPPDRPHRPRPSRPHDRPGYGQYASDYGQTSHDHDNSIYLEIYDPPSPYRPAKPSNDRPLYRPDTGNYGLSHGYGQNYGYGSYSSQNSYSQSHQSTYGWGSIANNNYDRPHDDFKPNRPSRPLYGPEPDYDSGYSKPTTQKPKDPYKNPYDPGYESQASYGGSQSSYESSHSSHSEGYHGSSHTHYDRPDEKPYGPKPDYPKPGSSGYRPSDYDSPGYPSQNRPYEDYNKPSHSQGGYRPAYDDRPDKPSYGSTHKPSDPYDKPSYGRPQSSYGGHQGSYESHQGSYGTQESFSSQGSYSSSQGSYGSQGYGSSPDYGGTKGSYPGSHSYGDPGPYKGSKGSYGGSKGSGNKGSYGSSQGYEGTKGSYSGNQYGENHGSYGSQSSQGSYGGSQSSYGSQGSHGGSQGSHGGNQGSYGNSQGSYTSHSHSSQYESSQASYGSTQSSQNSNSEAGYQKPGNDSDPDRPDVKPVYEYELDKPSNVPSYIARPGGEIVTSRPMVIGDYGRPEYGRDPGQSYKACFRRVLAGRRALRSHVRKAVPCERLEDCRRECAEERRFPCESFNYRLDPSFRGKGLCELMTKPIEAFNLHRDFVDDKDYDFYERDRNSLEPNCPETIRGPGLLHSGYLSSKGGHRDQWSDRADYYVRYHSYDRHHSRGRYGNRRYEDQFFVPYQIGLARTNDDQENWGQYGGFYGGYDNYYKDRNDYHKSISHWRLAEDRPTFAKPFRNNNFDYHSLAKHYGSRDNFSYGYGSWKRGRWNSSKWGGLDYGESNYYTPKSHFYEPVDRNDEPVKDCSSRRRPGMSLGSGAIRRSLIARNVVECEASCFSEREFKCVSYSYRYSSSRGTDNCFLSERPYRGLELSADSGSDVYAMPQDHGCATINYKPWVESECFWHVRSGNAISNAAVRSALTVTGLGACEAECIRAHAFFCRGFSFRFDAPTIGDDLENCILTSSPPTSLESGHGLRPTAGHELYARGNYGRGCEPALYDDARHRETECYLQYDSAAKLTGSAVRGQARVRSEQACGVACTEAPFRCLSFSYNNNAPPDVDNCLLSEIRLFDLQKGVDYEHSPDDWLFAFDLFNGQCWRKVHGNDEPTPELPRPLPPSAEEHYPVSGPPSGPPGPPGFPAPPAEPPYLPSGPSGPPNGHNPYLPDFKPYPGSSPGFTPGYIPDRPYTPGFRPSEPYPPSEPGYRPIKPGYRPLEPGYRPSEPSGPGYKPLEPSGPGYKPLEPSGSGFKPAFPPGYRPEEFRPGYGPGPDRPRPVKPVYGDREENGIAVSWRHYTVSGFPCRQGTSCAQNQIAGHWACEPEGGEIGSWDYCCAPNHRCGYSEGFQKPWCYVGQAEDQWRPCSDKYYPYHQHNVPHPSQGHKEDRPRPSKPWNRPYPDDRDRPIGPYLSEADRKYWDELYKNGPQAYYDKYGNPLPGYSRVPTEGRPHIKYHQNYPDPGSGIWLPVSALEKQEDTPTVPGGLGAPRYWPVAYLHKGPPPNMTYFRYNETKTTTEKYEYRPERYEPRPEKYEPRPEKYEPTPEKYEPRPPTVPPKETPPEFRKIDIDLPKGNNIENKNRRDEKTRNISNVDEDIFQLEIKTTTKIPEKITTTTEKIENKTDLETKQEKMEIEKELDTLKGIDDKMADFLDSIEVLDIEDAKIDEKSADLKTLEAEERQIEAIGRLLASRRGGKLVIEKRSQKELESKNIAVDKDLVEFNFGNKFPISERRGTVQRVSKDDIEKDRYNDKSLEVSETTFVRPPRVLSTTDNIRKAIVNGKVFYDATIREQRDIFNNTTRKPKSFRLEDSRAPSVLNNTSFGKKKVIKTRNVNPVRRVRRVYRKKYNPEEVRRRLLERERSMKQESSAVINKRA